MIFTCLVLLIIFMCVCLQASYLPDDQVPKSHATIYPNVVHSGNITLSKVIDNRYLYVGSVDRFFLRDMESDFELKADIPWQPDDSDRDFCKMMHVDTECHNFIKVIEKNDENDKLLVCGTNAYVPSCRYYDDYTIQNTEEFGVTTGLYKSPNHPGPLNTAIFANGSLYVGTASTATKSVIARSVEKDDLLQTDLRTEDSDSRWLNEPDFISSFDIGQEVFFFLREIAMEYSNYGKIVYSRVAKVCKKDQGGSDHVLENIWTTFLKARIICSFPGEFPFYFNNIQDTFKISYEENGKTTNIFYAVFTTPKNAIPGSAICAYNLTDVNAVFNGGFLAKDSAKHAWLPVEEDIVPDPRPGTCVDDSTSHSYNDLLFFKSHTLMSDTLNPSSGYPLFTVTRQDYTLTQIVVDRVQTRSGTYDVMFIGTDHGQVLKVVLFVENGQQKSNLIDVRSVGDTSDSNPIVSLQLIVLGDTKSILVGTPTSLVNLDIQRCKNLSSCACLQDPYCGLLGSQCVVFTENEIGIVQNVTNVMECPVEPESCQCMEPTTEFLLTRETLPTSVTTATGGILGSETVQVTTPTRVRLYDTSLKSPLYTDHNIPPQSEYPIEITSQDPVTTETSNIIGPPIEPPEHRTVVGVENDYSVVEGIAIAGWVVAAVLGIFIIGYFCVARVRKSERGICCRRGRLDVSTRQTEEGMKSPLPATTTPVVPIAPVTPVVTPVVTPTTIDSENTKNTQQETPLRREKPPVPQKPKNYAASINDRRAVNDQRASSLSQNRRSQPHESFKDVSGELKNMFIHSNGSHTQQQGIGPTRGGKVAHV